MLYQYTLPNQDRVAWLGLLSLVKCPSILIERDAFASRDLLARTPAAKERSQPRQLRTPSSPPLDSSHRGNSTENQTPSPHNGALKSPSAKDHRRHSEPGPPRTPPFNSSHDELMLLGASPLGSPDAGLSILPGPLPLNTAKRVDEGLHSDPSPFQTPKRGDKRLLSDPSPLQIPNRVGERLLSVQAPSRVNERLLSDPAPLQTPSRVNQRLLSDPSPLQTPNCVNQRLLSNSSPFQTPNRVDERLLSDPSPLQTPNRVDERLLSDPSPLQAPNRVNQRLLSDPSPLQTPNCVDERLLSDPSPLQTSNHVDERLLSDLSPLQIPNRVKERLLSDPSPLRTPKQELMSVLSDPSLPSPSKHTEDGGMMSKLPNPSPVSPPDDQEGMGLNSMLPNPSPVSSPESQGGRGLKTDLSPPSSPEQGAEEQTVMLPDPSPPSSPQEGLKGTADGTNAGGNSPGIPRMGNQTLPSHQSPQFSHTLTSQEAGDGVEEMPLFTTATPKLTSQFEQTMATSSKHRRELQDLVYGRSSSTPNIQLPPPLQGGSFHTPNHMLSLFNDIQPPSPFQHAMFDLDMSGEPSTLQRTTTTSAQGTRDGPSPSPHPTTSVQGAGDSQGELVLPTELDQSRTNPVVGSLIDFSTPGKPTLPTSMHGQDPSQVNTNTTTTTITTAVTSQGPKQQTLPSFHSPSKGQTTPSHGKLLLVLAVIFYFSVC